VTTAELDAVAARVFARHGARSGPRLDYGFPGTVCLSVDDECVHGLPGPHRLRAGELVKLDVTAELNGYYADACVTAPVGRIRPRTQRLVAAAGAALRRGLDAATAGAPVGAIGAAVEREVRRRASPSATS
jgi:methionyl aminopeptidase